MQRITGKAGLPEAKEPDYIELDGDLDELMMEIPCSSPFFTQPTQVIKRATQPTQIVGRTTQPTQLVGGTTQPTQILDRTTQPTQVTGRTTLYPPSSPFGPSSPGAAIEVPASSPFQPKSRPKGSPFIEKKRGVTSRIGSLMAPAGTSFRPPTGQPIAASRSVAKMKAYLTISDDELSEDYKRHDSSGDESPMRGDIKPSSFVRKDFSTLEITETKPAWTANRDIELRDIHDLRLRHLTKDVYKIVSKNKPTITIKACRDALTSGVGWQVPRAVNLLLGSTGNGNHTTNSSLSKAPIQMKQSTLFNSFDGSTHPTKSSSQKDCSGTLNSTSTSTPTSSNSATPSFSSNNQPPRRRRLVQGRKAKSPTPPPVFSVSSSASSAPTTPARSETHSSSKGLPPPTTMKVSSFSQAGLEPIEKPRRRLQRGRRDRTPPPAVITLDSGSNSESEFPPPDRLSSRKRKAETEVEPEPVDVAASSDHEEDSNRNHVVHKSPHHEQVLSYLNSCTTESLAQISGFSTVDSKLLVSHRPFDTIFDAEIVSKKESKAKYKSKRVQIGSLFVEKLTSWFAAFHAASEVIKQCEERGAKLQKAMANWTMDKNGRCQEGTTLPVSEKPRLMAEDITLKTYQLLGLNWMNLLHSKRFSGILADDMGLGKTCQVISIIAHLVGTYDKKSRTTRPWPFLVVVPPSVCENWMAEFERFAPELSVCPYLGKDRRNMDPDEARNNHVVLTSYSQVEKAKEDLYWLQELDPYAAIFDEGHKLKNRKNLIYKQMMRVPTEWRLILSGTPVQNNLKELLTLLHFVEPRLFGNEIFEQLDTIFEAKVPNKEIHNFAALAKERVSNARVIMAPFILQRRKEEVLDLAKKTEHNVVVEMHPKQKAIYDEVKGRYLVPKKERASSTIKDSHSWMQLRKAAIHHQLFRVHFTDEAVRKMVDILWDKCSEEELYVQSKADRHKKLLLESYMDKSDFQLHLECKHFKKYIGHFDIPQRSWEDGPKVQKLLELVRGYMANGDRVLVFSRFDLVIDILRETLAFADIPYCELTGSTDISDRFPEIQRFNENPDIPVFLLTTGAGGTGLNLTAANKIIIFDQSDNPQDDVQASNRAHRIGQTRDVEVIRLITRDSVEGLIFNSCVKKLMLARIVEGNIPVDEDAENESVEQQCRRLMLLEGEGASSQASQVT
ncbi:putative chromodomain-helicase-DNA-binding protein 3 [Rosellinia necatrix]|uniref:Putative chromodomain-helicase-DNA-binding protein 3 n=1 Tax=Rosellinia necatrix TaxID=77044 RepID=A0A1S7UJE8_ROSNE|nr:putative chromodomain-helicase-DNA-binding protein 3 [Rosellinia necatrix]